MRKYLFLAALSLFAFVGCNKSGGNNNNNTVGTGVVNGVVTTAAGTYVMAGTLTMISPNCGGVGAATISVSLYGGGGGYPYGGAQTPTGTTSVGVGGTFSLGVAAGSYLLTAQGGSCTVSAICPALTNGQQGYQICLGSTCSTYSYGGYSGYQASSCQQPYYRMLASSTSLASRDPAHGDIAIDSANIYFTAGKATALDLGVNLTAGNSLLDSHPQLGEGWKGTIAADNSVKVGAASADHLSYSVQVDANLLQWDAGFCDTNAAALQKSIDYLKQAGLSDKSTQAFEVAWVVSKYADKVCVYPQGQSAVEAVAPYKGSSKMSASRVWLVVLAESQVSATNSKFSKKIAKLVSRPKSDAVAALKKHLPTRKIASDSDILADEWGLGSVIEK